MRRARLCLVLTLLAAALVAAQSDGLRQPAQLTEQAPDVYRARVQTSQGVFVIEVHRAWAPLAADRFFNLVKHGFYDEARFFRVLSGFMVQFGLHADGEIQRAWQTAPLKDEPSIESNRRGFVTFTKENLPNSRYTQVFISLVDNDYLDAQGFAPFGQVVTGMEIVDRLYSGYGRQNVPDQRRIIREGNAYLLAEFPKLDYVRSASIERK